VVKIKTAIRKVLEFLANNPTRPYTPKKIAERIGLNHSTVKYCLSTLHSIGMVEYYEGMRGVYIISAEGKRLSSALRRGDC